jgi:hypothetical protein
VRLTVLREPQLPAFLLIPVALLFSVSSAWGAEFHVSPEGKPSGSGSADSPWDLATALAPPPAVRPGDTIWLHQGSYTGNFTSKLAGTPAAPIVVRQYSGETATLCGVDAKPTPVLRIEGSATWFEDFTITNSNSVRTFSAPLPDSQVLRNRAVDVYGSNTKLINLIIHDAGQGAGLWSQAADTELYGCIIYNNGVLAPDRGHGHGVYMQNDHGVKILRDNILFNEFGSLLQAYGSAAASIRNIRMEGNVAFNGRFIVGGANPAEDILFRSNFFYRTRPGFGYDSKANQRLTIEDNYLPSGVNFNWWRDVTVRNNTFYDMVQDGQSKTIAVTLAPGGTTADYTIDHNTYFQSYENGNDFYVRFPRYGANYTFPKWQQELGYDKSSVYHTAAGQRVGPPNAVFVRRNEYDQARAHVIIYNWEHRDTVDVDVSALGLRPGDSWELRNVQNYLLESVSGVYAGGPIQVPMNKWTVAKPFGYEKPLGRSTFPEFGVFVLQKIAPGQGTRISQERITWLFSTSATFTWKTDRPASTEIEYGTTSAFGATFQLDGPLSTDHAIGLRGLKPATTYYYRLRSVDQSGRVTFGRPLTFQTAP